MYLFYDPSAGSPTETLLRLLLPLSAPVRASFRRSRLRLHYTIVRFASPRISLVHPIGSSDGRCVQRAGTESRQAQWPAATRHSSFVGKNCKPQAQASHRVKRAIYKIYTTLDTINLSVLSYGYPLLSEKDIDMLCTAL